MKKLWISLAIISCNCFLAQAQSTEQQLSYENSIILQVRFNKIQREAGLPEIDVPSFGEWQRAEERKKTVQIDSAAARIDQNIRWLEKLEKIRPQLCKLVPIQDISKSVRSEEATNEQEHLFEFANRAYEQQPAIERKLDEIAAKYGVLRRETDANGNVQVLAGEFAGNPIWLENHNRIAAAGISADELWPINSAPWPSSSTGKDLAGADVVLGMWEVGGGVNTNHQEFSGRVLQCESSSVLSDHATGVAGTMVANGNTISLSGLPTGELARGVAFNAYLDAYEIARFNEEVAEASAGTASFPGLRLSNHSWGVAPQRKLLQSIYRPI